MKTGVLPMLPGTSLPLPASLANLLAVFGPLFTAPSFPHLHRAGLRVPGADREADGVRDAGRGGPVAGLAA